MAVCSNLSNLTSSPRKRDRVEVILHLWLPALVLVVLVVEVLAEGLALAPSGTPTAVLAIVRDVVLSCFAPASCMTPRAFQKSFHSIDSCPCLQSLPPLCYC
ncbi:hypothetical protein EON64_11415 [archaeon]|nr:MAG: hypothetical protein EON64_11415 [archaeon]